MTLTLSSSYHVPFLNIDTIAILCAFSDATFPPSSDVPVSSVVFAISYLTSTFIALTRINLLFHEPSQSQTYLVVLLVVAFQNHGEGSFVGRRRILDNIPGEHEVDFHVMETFRTQLSQITADPHYVYRLNVL
jgi:hypothetical protein